MGMTKEQELAWAAGFFEGEGCATMTAQGAKSQWKAVYLEIGSTDLDVLERWMDIVQCGNIKPIKNAKVAKNPHWKPAWRWRAGASADVIRVMAMLLPYMGERRTERFMECLDHLTKRTRRTVAPEMRTMMTVES